MKRLFPVFLALMMVLCLFGCSSQEVQETQAPAQVQLPETTQETTVPPTTQPMTWQEHYDRGLSLMQGKDWQGAYASFDAAVALDPQQADAYVQRGEALIRTEENEQNLEAALADYQQALTLDPSHVQAHLGITDIHIRRAEYEEALAYLKSAAENLSDPAVDEQLAKMEANIFKDSQNTLRYAYEEYFVKNKYIGYTTQTYDKDTKLRYYKSFDAKGNPVSSVELKTTKEGNVKYKDSVLITIEEDAVYIEKVTYITTTNPDGSYEEELIYYDQDGNISASSKEWYDINKCLIKHDYFDANGVLTHYYANEYDDNGNCVIENFYNADGTLNQRKTFEYDSEGRRVRTNIYYSSEELSSYTLHLYDEFGNPVGNESYDSSGNLKTSSNS